MNKLKMTIWKEFPKEKIFPVNKNIFHTKCELKPNHNTELS